MPKGSVSLGIEFDTQAIRAARIRFGKPGFTTIGTPFIESLTEVTGTFTTDEAILAGLKNIRQHLPLPSVETIVTCVGGKYVYVAQLTFRKLPDDEMKNALKLELRKNLPFDTGNTTIDYQYLTQPQRKTDTAQVIATVVATPYLQRQLGIFEKAGIPPNIIDVFPLTVVNAFLLDRSNLEKSDRGRIVLHIGPDFSTIVIEGSEVPFFTRMIYFNAAALYDKPLENTGGAPDPYNTITTFAHEITRSIVYYETTFHSAIAAEITVLGSYAIPSLLTEIGRITGLTVIQLDLVKRFESKQTAVTGRFDIAVSLAMRGIQ